MGSVKPAFKTNSRSGLYVFISTELSSTSSIIVVSALVSGLLVSELGVFSAKFINLLVVSDGRPTKDSQGSPASATSITIAAKRRPRGAILDL
jgi:hypothetical protein